jgi:hypothetical protein
MDQPLLDWDETPLDAGTVRARLDVWRRNLDALYAQIEAWLPSGQDWTVVRSGVMRLERAMSLSGVPMAEFPALGVGRRPDAGAAQSPGLVFVPDALWVFPTNGRVRVCRGSEVTHIINVGTDDVPVWKIYPYGDPMHSVPFDRGQLETLVRELPA